MAFSFVIFFHIPKTAGMAFKRALHQAVGDRLVWFMKWPDSGKGRMPIKHISSFDEISIDQLSRKYRVLGGHVSYRNIPKTLLDVNPVFIAVVRDPLTRAMSFYDYIKRNERHSLHADLYTLTFYEALKVPRFRKMVNNQQCRYLCGKRNFKALIKKLQKHRYVIGKFENLPPFLEAVKEHAKLRILLGELTRNSGSEQQKAEIRAQSDFDLAVQEVTKLNGEDYKLYGSFRDVLVKARELTSLPPENERVDSVAVQIASVAPRLVQL